MDTKEHAKWGEINKERLMVFTDAIMAIIMTILVLDIKVPPGEMENDEQLFEGLMHQVPHLMGFILSFALIAVIWFSHHTLFASLKKANHTFTLLNFIFVGAIATMPFSTALVSENPYHSLAVVVLAVNGLFMNVFLTALYIYAEKNNLIEAGYTPERVARIKRGMGMAGVLLFVAAAFIAYLSTTIALILIAAVPLMHCIPVGDKKKK